MPSMVYYFKNLVFEGGGVKGIAYVGALQVLSEKGILDNIERVGGSSVGAITALLVGLNYHPEEIKDIFSKLDFRNFLDDSWGIIREVQRLVYQYGWYKGDFFYNWVSSIIAAKVGNADATFTDVFDLRQTNKYQDMYFTGTNLSTGFSEVFSYETTPDMSIAEAVRISMSVPLFFTAVRDKRDHLYVDGGLLDNYPIRLFDQEKYVNHFSTIPSYYDIVNTSLQLQDKITSPYVYNQETLGFRLDSTDEIAVYRDHAEPLQYTINDFFSYSWRLIATIIESQQNQHLHSEDWHRTIYINTPGIRTMDFGIDNMEIGKMVKSGRENTLKYFDWYDNLGSMPLNRPKEDQHKI
ncbi:hypothetical protein SPSIL_039130 [Sporomusa silvacetica DSM 10669]|uniref:PNPLA domain-containing protein n=1 Tax=Sporomusa silvacetica DSM 10669 TaxID=1123289 RepID=A0ABZ3IQK5_9FIRM|nr:hypothetical protein SPSIL_51460 [Sporomusa silvacetica DSM 10669]